MHFIKRKRKRNKIKRMLQSKQRKQSKNVEYEEKNVDGLQKELKRM